MGLMSRRGWRKATWLVLLAWFGSRGVAVASRPFRSESGPDPFAVPGLQDALTAEGCGTVVSVSAEDAQQLELLWRVQGQVFPRVLVTDVRARCMLHLGKGSVEAGARVDRRWTWRSRDGQVALEKADL